MNTYAVAISIHPTRIDETVIRLRKRGFTAYTESTDARQFYIVTDASRAAVILDAGHGLFLESQF